MRSSAVGAVTALAPATWGTTYLVTTELLPPDRPLAALVLSALWLRQRVNGAGAHAARIGAAPRLAI